MSAVVQSFKRRRDYYQKNVIIFRPTYNKRIVIFLFILISRELDQTYILSKNIHNVSITKNISKKANAQIDYTSVELDTAGYLAKVHKHT